MKTKIEFYNPLPEKIFCQYEENNAAFSGVYFCTCTDEKIATALTDTLNALHLADQQDLLESL